MEQRVRGLVELGERAAAAAERETLEETGLRVRVDPTTEIVERYPFRWGGVLRDVTTHSSPRRSKALRASSRRCATPCARRTSVAVSGSCAAVACNVAPPAVDGGQREKTRRTASGALVRVSLEAATMLRGATATFPLIILSVACSKQKAGDATPTPPQTEKAKPKPKQGTATVAASFDDSVAHDAKVTFSSGRTRVIGHSLVLELSNEPVLCGGESPSNDAWVAWIEVPLAPDAASKPSAPRSTLVAVDPWSSPGKNKKLDEHSIKPPNVALKLEQLGTKPGQRIVGTLDVDDTLRKGHRYTMHGAFDVPVCEADFDHVFHVDGAPGDASSITGSFGKAAVAPKSAVLLVEGGASPFADDVGNHASELLLFSKTVDCDTWADAAQDGGEFLFVTMFGGTTATHDHSGAWQPAEIVRGKRAVQSGYSTQDVYAFVKLDARPKAAGEKITGALVAQAVADADHEAAGTNLGGKFTALVCRL